jgi:hypothetical protein
VYPFKDEIESLERLGLSKPIAPVPKERKSKGRPRKKPELVGPKRPLSHPRKIENITCGS